MKHIFRFLAGALCMLLLLGNNQCTNNNNTNNGAPVFVTTLQVQDAGGNAATSFVTGVTIQFQITVRNRTSSAQTLFFNGSEQSNFAVIDSNGNVVWTSDHGTPACTSGTSGSSCTGTSAAIPAESSTTFTASWTQVNNSNNTVALGTYEVIGGVTVFNTTGLTKAQDTSGDVMPFGIPTGAELFPSTYRSPLMQFTIVQ